MGAVTRLRYRGFNTIGSSDFGHGTGDWIMSDSFSRLQLLHLAISLPTCSSAGVRRRPPAVSVAGCRRISPAGDSCASPLSHLLHSQLICV